MSTYSDIITAVKARVDTVTNIGSTHGYQRYNADWSAYLSQFRTTIGGVDQIRAWVVTMEDNNPIVGMMENSRYGAINRQYNVLIFGFLGLDDSANTEQTFLNLVEAVMDAVDGRIDLGVTGVTDYSVGPAALRTYQIRQLGSVLSHYCEISLPVIVEKSVSYA